MVDRVLENNRQSFIFYNYLKMLSHFNGINQL